MTVAVFVMMAMIVIDADGACGAGDDGTADDGHADDGGGCGHVCRCAW